MLLKFIMKCNNKLFGNFGEKKVCDFLIEHNYLIIATQYSYNHQLGEIDIIAKKENTIVFVEVKSRMKKHNITILELISKKKQRSIVKMAFIFLQFHGMSLEDYIIRFDLAYVVSDNIEYYENAFTSDF